ncbi:MAG: type 1 glutamine amidotransferase [Bacteroidota bacterium]
MQILIFKHIHHEPAGHAEQWAAERGYPFTYHYWNEDHVLTTMPDFDLLIIMGGMMGAYEEHEYPWLITEKRLIREAIEGGKKVIGICLGAQLIASALGAKVYKNVHAEIGFHHIVPVGIQPGILPGIQENLQVFQWHGDTFDLPAGACLIATSENIKNQAFTYGANTYAIQFHPKMNENIVEGLLESAWDREPSSPWKQSRESIRSMLGFTLQGRALLFNLLDAITTQ